VRATTGDRNRTGGRDQLGRFGLENDAWRATLELVPGSRRDGDTYSVRIARPGSSEPIAEAQDTVTYAESSPNGEECDDESCVYVASGPFAAR